MNEIMPTTAHSNHIMYVSYNYLFASKFHSIALAQPLYHLSQNI